MARRLSAGSIPHLLVQFCHVLVQFCHVLVQFWHILVELRTAQYFSRDGNAGLPATSRPGGARQRVAVADGDGPGTVTWQAAS
jgi:hypothetical protein